ncbi:hypothetical protein E2C01_004866 [Portunus trituberculatus]|uniref:Uncharacterized protein n=1 Tax=Portunus trituberculatus TaxID=210409 RepID=A0A5B7CST3_PORTR|nr:hypothetical protein [Portunus trituberculatus]
MWIVVGGERQRESTLDFLLGLPFSAANNFQIWEEYLDKNGFFRVSRPKSRESRYRSHQPSDDRDSSHVLIQFPPLPHSLSHSDFTPHPPFLLST